MSVSADAPPIPFKGLAAFQDTELDAQLFCGRDREREVIVANLLASRLTVLYGASGVGKTSLLRAAVAHSIRRVHDAAVVLFSSWAGDPRGGLAAAIDDAVGIEAGGTLTERLRAASKAVGGDVYVIPRPVRGVLPLPRARRVRRRARGGDPRARSPRELPPRLA